jgi:hypothetical protein
LDPHDEIHRDHARYARVLEVAVHVSLTLLVLAFIAYVSGFVPEHVPVDELSRYWGLPVGEYLRQTGMPSGWGWIKLVMRGDVMNLAGVALLASVAPLCMLVLLPIYAARRDGAYIVITLLNIAVVVLAASGRLGT